MKKPLSLLLLLCLSAANIFSQQYLDDDKRTLQLTEISTDPGYGYEPDKPIEVGTAPKADGAYLNALKSPTGEPMHIANMQFDYMGKTGLEMIELSYEGKTKTTVLYISTAAYKAPKCPQGFLFKTADGMPKVVKFPADSIAQVWVCDGDNLFTVDDMLLKEKLELELPEPGKAPEYSGGPEALQQYFTAHPLTDEKAKQLVFRVSIGFIVNCEGKAGNYFIVTQGRGELETYANQVLAIVNDLPQNWQPATKKGKPVDCYQVISFTVLNGSLAKATYE